ncbi:MAG: hybrid sensor histidine kinase/response regulator [Tenuifilaceae bacterium]|jgi:signal transduction histidine kinase|nr:hybrid sensor histidine kinase/response regulator [Tenuifilaceae bacterium]
METLEVLVVDDEFGIRSGIARILRNFTVSYPFMNDDIQFNITEAATGEEALDIINTKPPDIVLLDNKLPGIQGVEVLEYINSKQLNTLVVMITSYASLDLAVKATNVGAYDFVPKPFTPQELKASMENVTKHHFLRRMTRKLHKEGKQVRFQFLTLLSHELKSPLNVIEGYLKIMHERQAGENLASYDKMIDQSMARIKSMRTLIMDLLDLTRIESGGMKRSIRELDLGLVANSAIDTMMPMAIQQDIELCYDRSTSLPFQADSEEMEIIFNNLISNAIKYNNPGGKVMCSLQKFENEIHFSVTDTGMGIANEDRPKLFMEFSRIRTSKTKDVSGSGLGLSIVKRLVDLYGGKVLVESTPNVGSTFTVVLPIPQNFS